MLIVISMLITVITTVDDLNARPREVLGAPAARARNTQPKYRDLNNWNRVLGPSLILS